MNWRAPSGVRAAVSLAAGAIGAAEPVWTGSTGAVAQAARARAKRDTEAANFMDETPSTGEECGKSLRPLHSLVKKLAIASPSAFWVTDVVWVPGIST